MKEEKVIFSPRVPSAMEGGCFLVVFESVNEEGTRTHGVLARSHRRVLPLYGRTLLRIQIARFADQRSSTRRSPVARETQAMIERFEAFSSSVR